MIYKTEELVPEMIVWAYACEGAKGKERHTSREKPMLGMITLGESLYRHDNAMIEESHSTNKKESYYRFVPFKLRSNKTSKDDLMW